MIRHPLRAESPGEVVNRSSSAERSKAARQGGGGGPRIPERGWRGEVGLTGLGFRACGGGGFGLRVFGRWFAMIRRIGSMGWLCDVSITYRTILRLRFKGMAFLDHEPVLRE